MTCCTACVVVCDLCLYVRFCTISCVLFVCYLLCDDVWFAFLCVRVFLLFDLNVFECFVWFIV